MLSHKKRVQGAKLKQLKEIHLDSFMSLHAHSSRDSCQQLRRREFFVGVIIDLVTFIKSCFNRTCAELRQDVSASPSAITVEISFRAFHSDCPRLSFIVSNRFPSTALPSRSFGSPPLLKFRLTVRREDKRISSDTHTHAFTFA